MDLANDVGDIASALFAADLQFPRLGIADIVEVDAVDVVTACDVATELGEVVACLRHLGVHIALVANLPDEVREAAAHLLTAVAVPFAYGDGDNPGMALHTALMALVDAELQGVVARRLSAIARHADVPGFHRRREDGAGPDARLYKNGVDVGLLQLVEDADKLLLLPVSRVGVGPVETFNRGEPYGSDFVNRRLCNCIL